MAAFNAATRDALELAKRLGGGWEPRVWENLGWHYEARTACGRLNVRPIVDYHRPTKPVIAYHAFLNPRGDGGGVWSESGKTPEEAITNTKRAAITTVNLYVALIPLLNAT